MAARGLLIAAPASGSGKTLITLGLMHAAARRGYSIAAAKCGPDYIDTGFHRAALGAPSVNLDPFAMPPAMLRALAAGRQGEVLLAEGVMGVHDGGDASSAALAATLGIPVLLVMDIRGMAETAGAIAAGIRESLGAMGVGLAGVLCNRAASPRHADMARRGIEAAGIAFIGAVAESRALAIPSRHLGLVQAGDMAGLEAMITAAADLCDDAIDIEAIFSAATPLADSGGDNNTAPAIPPPAKRIALAADRAFGFCYTHLREHWEAMGAEVIPFSPLADEAPDGDAGFIFLPGGYPELHLSAISNAKNFMAGMQTAAKKGVAIYGECGGYMVLGRGLTNRSGERFPMAGLLDLETDFSRPKRHLGYRRLVRIGNAPLPATLLGHEFHYSAALHEKGDPLFEAAAKDGTPLGSKGLVAGNVAGSYMHMIAAAP